RLPAPGHRARRPGRLRAGPRGPDEGAGDRMSSVAVSTISENYLPPKELQPQRIYTLPEFASYPDPLNSTEELLDKQIAAGRGDSRAILFADRTITYKQLLGASCKIGNALRKLGVEEGDRVMLRSPNVPPALFTNFGVLRLGAVIIPTSHMLSPTEVAHIA